MKRILIAITLLTALSLAGVRADPPMPAGPRLRDIVTANYPNGNVLIGATTGSWAFGTDQCVLMDREFSYVTPENDFKQSTVHRDPHSWNWSKADPWVQHILDHRQLLRIHGPVSPQCSSWARDDSRTPAELEQNMREFFTALCRRYNGRPGIISIDVVNETVLNGQWHTDKPGTGWECPWYIIGLDSDPHGTPLYIRYAFEIANQHAGDLKLIFNHHESPSKTSTWNLIKDTIAYLRARDLRVDGIGWQAHVDAGWDTPGDLDALDNLIDWAHNNDLEFHVTEASGFIPDTSPANLQLQSRTYCAIVNKLLEHRRAGLVGWNTWHISDAHGWKTDEFPSIFDDNYLPKPAYYELQADLLAQHDLLCDFNLDRRVNLLDLQYMASRWLSEHPIFEPADTDIDGKVDWADYTVFARNWLNYQWIITDR